MGLFPDRRKFIISLGVVFCLWVAVDIYRFRRRILQMNHLEEREKKAEALYLAGEKGKASLYHSRKLQGRIQLAGESSKRYREIEKQVKGELDKIKKFYLEIVEKYPDTSFFIAAGRALKEAQESERYIQILLKNSFRLGQAQRQSHSLEYSLNLSHLLQQANRDKEKGRELLVQGHGLAAKHFLKRSYKTFLKAYVTFPQVPQWKTAVAYLPALIDSNPPGANVYRGGKLIGVTPMVDEFLVGIGPLVYSLRKTGYVSQKVPHQGLGYKWNQGWIHIEVQLKGK